MVVTVSTNIPRHDRNRLFAFVVEAGGQMRVDLTEDTTHLVTLLPEGEKYKYVEKLTKPPSNPSTGLQVAGLHVVAILPHYFDDVMKLRKRLPEDLYTFPNPILLSVDPLEHLNSMTRRTHSATLPETARTVKALRGLTFYIEHGVDLSRRELERLVELGANVTGDYDESVKCVVANDRGKMYRQAVDDEKHAGGIEWIRAMLVSERWLDPESRVSFAPPPTPQQIPTSISSIKATVTNYTGKARDDIRRLLQAIGATYVPHLTSSGTLLISCFPTGQKYIKAREWNIPVVNHLWLEESYIKMQFQALTRPEFTTYCLNLPDIVDKTRYSSQQLASDSGKASAIAIKSHPSLPDTESDIIKQALVKSEEARDAQLREQLHQQEQRDKGIVEHLSSVATQMATHVATEVTKAFGKEVARTVGPIVEKMAPMMDELRVARVNSVKRMSTDHSKPTSPPQPYNPLEETSKRKRTSSPVRSRDTPRRDKPRKDRQYVVCTSRINVQPKDREFLASLADFQLVETVTDKTTHVVAKLERGQRNPVKLYTGICAGAHIVSEEWFKEIHQRRCMVDETPFLIRETLSGGYPCLAIPEMCRIARERGPVLRGVNVSCTANPTIEKVILQPIVQAAGGIWRDFHSRLPDDTLVLSSPEDVVTYSKNLHLYKADLIMQIVVSQNLTLDMLQRACLTGQVRPCHLPPRFRTSA